MILLPAPNDAHSGLTHRLVSENNLVQVGIFKVLFGHRVRAGFVDDTFGVNLDWCGGGNWADVERLYSLTTAILNRRPENRRCFAGLPGFSSSKPFFLDLKFLEIVGKAAGDDYEMVHLEKS